MGNSSAVLAENNDEKILELAEIRKHESQARRRKPKGTLPTRTRKSKKTVVHADRPNDSISILMRQLAKFEPLTKEREHELARTYIRGMELRQEDPNAYRQGLAARNLLILHNAKFVISKAHNKTNGKNASISLEDVASEGFLGLIKAVDKFNPDENDNKVLAYATWWLRAFMGRYVQDHIHTIRPDSATKKIYAKYGEISEAIKSTGGDHLKLEAVAKTYGVTVRELAEGYAYLSSHDNSLDELLPGPRGESGATRKDALPSPLENPEEKLVRDDSYNLVREGLTKILNDQEAGSTKFKQYKAVIYERILADEPLTLEQVGAKSGVSRERVRQIEKEIKEDLGNYVLRMSKEHLPTK